MRPIDFVTGDASCSSAHNVAGREDAHIVGFSDVGKLRGYSQRPLSITRLRNDVRGMSASQSTAAESAIRANQADAPRNIPGVRNAKTPGSLTEGSGIAQSALLVRGVRQRKTPQSADQGVQASGCCRLLGDYLGHRAVVRECPALAYGDVARSGGRLDLAPGAVRWETDHCIPDMGASSAGLAGGVRVASGT